ncbi:caspase domain-containing protein [Afipia sp. GAS231]|uniref:caspase family protein n=1 Tax=Afipia sp. GAS231 TaxID=1882747 RepID=UPI00087CF05D|nr:caspase domain-containing protein [Afipia sp. GAS231]SDM95542.1 Uncharacterized protein, contains caspase domain [Afipia sp. GAS231]
MRLTARVSIFTVCLLAMSGFPALLNSAFAQQPEKRIALVVGNGAYAKSPLATAANDAGLIAQTLQAAGFDVIGARDLDGDTLRKSFRDFVQKAEGAGPGAVAMVYLAGYGLQVAGENYFVPVDSAINRETDIPIEALRIGDYIRQLASLPLKASIVVLDTARQQPFVEGQIASGLALVEADPHMLIAYNAAPGTVAPPEQGPYGAYAQSLAEMIRAGGLPLPEVFNRVRLRVNEATKGAQVPWDTQKLDAPFVFFERAPDAPAQASPDQVAALRNKPIRDLGVQEAYTAAVERDTLQGYEDFLIAYPGDPLARRVRAIVAARREAITWGRTYRADTPNAYWSYLRRYPRGPHAGDARRRLAILTAPLEPPPAFAVIDYDVAPPPPEEIVYVDRPVLFFSDPEFDFAPPPPPPVYYLPPPPPDFIVLEPPPPPIGLFILPQPLFVPIPVYVVAPVYVAQPPNNIIYANIHNTTVINTVINQRPQPAPGGPNALPSAKGAVPAGATLVPPAAAQKASLIQQGKLPMPLSASINPAAKAGTPGAPVGQIAPANASQPANVAPNTLPQGHALPKANSLPASGVKGAPPPPAAGTSPANATNPSAKLAPQQPGTAASPAVPNAPAAGTPKGPTGVTALSKPNGPGADAKPKLRPETLSKPATVQPPSKPTAALPPKPTIQAVPKPPIRPDTRRAPPPRPAPQMAKPAPPPPPRVAAPPPRMAAPPPRMAAPPPRVAAPPPPPRPAPQIARPAPPPPPPRPAPPPPRPAAPAAKKCPPNVPRC